MKNSIFVLFSLIVCTSCSKEWQSPTTSPKDVVATMWQYIDENYVYFDLKSIDWASKKDIYLNKVNDNTSEDSLKKVCTDMLFELRDGHCFINHSKAYIHYDFKKGYDINFDLAIVKTKYLNNATQTKGYYTFGIIQDSIGYVYYERFSSGNYFQDVMQFFKDKNVKKIIIDIRNNGGGAPEIPVNMIGYFVNVETPIGTIQHKSGKSHGSFSDKISLKAQPKNLFFDKKVNVLTNRQSYSASSYFAGMVRYLPNFQLIGQITGGGGGAAAAYELPNGWVVGVTSNIYRDAKDGYIENGVSSNIAIENTKDDLAAKRDKMLEKAMAN
jgi:Peptidase family S41/Tricorn protease C1 domain